MFKFLTSRKRSLSIKYSVLISFTSILFLSFQNCSKGFQSTMQTDQSSQASFGISLAFDTYDQTAYVGETVRLQINAASALPLKYAWSKNDVLIPTAKLSLFEIANATEADAGVYTVIASNEKAQLIGQKITVRILPVPSSNQAAAISEQPQSQSVMAGANVSFQVTASGFPSPQYQWMKNGVALVGQALNHLNLTAVAASHAGHYSVRVFNDLGSVTSQTAELIVSTPVLTAPTLASLMTNLSLHVGDSIVNEQFCVTASGTSPFEYIWKKDSVILATATGRCVLISNLTLAHSGSYQVTVKNAAGEISATRSISVTEVPVSCPITNGTGLMTSSGCQLQNCNTMYSPYNNTCVSTKAICEIEHGAGEKTWNGTAYGYCAVVTCNTDYHSDGTNCMLNTISCAIEGGNGKQNYIGPNYSTCQADTCNFGFHKEGLLCVSDEKSCVTASGIAAQQIWNGTQYGACKKGFEYISAFHTPYTIFDLIYKDNMLFSGINLLDITNRTAPVQTQKPGGGMMVAMLGDYFYSAYNNVLMKRKGTEMTFKNFPSDYSFSTIFRRGMSVQDNLFFDCTSNYDNQDKITLSVWNTTSATMTLVQQVHDVGATENTWSKACYIVGDLAYVYREYANVKVYKMSSTGITLYREILNQVVNGNFIEFNGFQSFDRNIVTSKFILGKIYSVGGINVGIFDATSNSLNPISVITPPWNVYNTYASISGNYLTLRTNEGSTAAEGNRTQVYDITDAAHPKLIAAGRTKADLYALVVYPYMYIIGNQDLQIHEIKPQ